MQRLIELKGSANFRDIGGYPTVWGERVRWNRLYRSDALANLTEDDLIALQPIGVTTIIDLRSHDELAESGPSPLIAAHGTRHRHVPFMRQQAGPTNYEHLPPLSELYVQMIEHGGPALKAIFEVLADERTYPAVVHCAAGKDRTGVTIALVLRTLGVDDDTIAADYALTAQAMERIIERLRQSGRLAELPRMNPDLMTANAETMLGLLHTVDTRFGGTEQVLKDSGVPAGTGEHIRALLLESR
jgi:protein tyrosine/serine phosphatase